MDKQFQHALLPATNSDEQAHQEFVQSLQHYCMSDVMPGVLAAYEKQVHPRLVREYGREPETRQEVRREMERHPYYQMASSFQRTSKELLWESVDQSILRQLPELVDKANELTGGKTKGSLTLDPDLEIPRYVLKNDHHVMPGGYSAELCDGDIAAGALYDRGAYLFADGLFGEKMDNLGKLAVWFIKKHFPEMRPERILKIGCNIGASTLPLKEAWPEADVHGIDVAPVLLRYGHARAEDLGVAVHFHQMDAENLKFEDNSFDIVYSVATFHELNRRAVSNVIDEAHRVLKPGGAFVNGEQPPYEGKPAFEQFLGDWDTLNNNEPFWGAFHDMDVVEMCRKAGFRKAWDGYGPTLTSLENMEATFDPSEIVGTDRGGSELWFFAAIK